MFPRRPGRTSKIRSTKSVSAQENIDVYRDALIPSQSSPTMPPQTTIDRHSPRGAAWATSEGGGLPMERKNGCG